MITITHKSHLDHGLDVAHVRFILERFADKQGFFIETIDIPGLLGDVPCALRGPSVGTKAVPDDEIIMRARNGRTWPSRMMRKGYALMVKKDHVSWAPLYVRTLTVIAGPHVDAPCMLYTAYGGPCAPREPGDPSLVDAADIAASKSFWSAHALTE